MFASVENEINFFNDCTIRFQGGQSMPDFESVPSSSESSGWWQGENSNQSFTWSSFTNHTWYVTIFLSYSRDYYKYQWNKGVVVIRTSS